jgi:WD40 repeat protein
VNELVSTHGYSQNQIVVWSCPTMTPLARLTGHTMRVLYLAVAPDGQTIVTGAGDETLRVRHKERRKTLFSKMHLVSFGLLFRPQDRRKYRKGV